MSKGISNEVQATSRKKFNPKPTVNNGLCIGSLTDVEVVMRDMQVDTKMTSFRGKAIPVINFHFQSELDAPGVKTAYYTHTFMPYEHVPVNVMDKNNAWKWDGMIAMIKHWHEVLGDNRPLNEEEVKLMQFNLVEKENGTFKEQPIDEVIKAWTAFFNGVAAVFKGGYKIGKDVTAPSMLQDLNGKAIVLWLKLLLYSNGKEVNNGDPGITIFPGEGVMCKLRQGVAPEVRIKTEKGESIIPMVRVNKTAAAMPTANATGVTVPESDIPDFMKQPAANNDVPY